MLLMMILSHLMIDAGNILVTFLPILYDFFATIFDTFILLNVVMAFHDKQVW